MTDDELFAFVKPKIKGIAPDSDFYDDDIRFFYIPEVLGFMEGAGVPESEITEKTAGVVVIGVNDLFDLPSGVVKFSPYFIQRVSQLEAIASRKKKEAAANV